MKRIIIAVLAGLALPLAAHARAVGDNAPIKIVVPYSAGGPSDIVTRVVAKQMSISMGGRPIVVENRPGATGIIGLEYVARSPGDGKTLVMFSLGGSVLNSVLKKKLPFNVTKDFTAIGNMVNMAQLLVVNPKLPVKTVPELVAYGKAHPDALNYGSSGIGSSPHLLGELFQQKYGFKMTHVPYPGTGPATAALLSDQIQVMFTEVPVLLPSVKAGQLRALSVGTRTRSDLLPDVPDSDEANLGFVATNWFGLEVPASTPPELVNELNKHLVNALRDPETAKTLMAMGATPDPGPPSAFNSLVRSELSRWGAVAKASHISVDD